MADPSDSVVQQLDSQLEQFFAGWNVYSTLLVVLTITIVFYPLFLGSEPDIHPFLLGRQATGTPVRQPGESAVYRGADIPHGYPLRSGLNVKEEGTPMYVTGRDGNLTDIWKKAIIRATSGQSFIALRGKDVAEKQSAEHLSKELNAVGKHLQSKGVSRVAVCLHNSTELLTALFAGSFYGFTVILVSPTRWSVEELQSITKFAKADALIAPAGLFPPSFANESGLKSVVWVVEPNSRHMDFAETASSNSAQWHEIASKDTVTELPTVDAAATPPKVVTVHPKSTNAGFTAPAIVEYSQSHIVAAVGAQLSALPRNHTITATDVVLSLESLADSYALVITLAGIYAGSSVALLSAAGGRKVDFDIAFAAKSLNPSIIIASSETMARAHANKSAGAQDILSKLRRGRASRSLAAGTMSLVDQVPNRPFSRVVYISETPSWKDSVPLTSAELNDLRILTRSRIIYSLIVPEVAGAVAQTHLLDYRLDPTTPKRSHFGPPLGALEMRVVDTPSVKVADQSIRGELVVNGPAVVGVEHRTGLTAQIRDDGTLALA